jgi:uncharacterized lipoprotein YajG
MKRTVFVMFAAMLLAGCASRPQALTNRAACTAAGDQAYVVSMWGPIGVASPIDKRDGEVICRR